jgi:hypothetical protein
MTMRLVRTWALAAMVVASVAAATVAGCGSTGGGGPHFFIGTDFAIALDLGAQNNATPDLATGPTGCAAQGLSTCNGNCVDLPTDPNNCGACARTCSQTQACIGGACVNSGCTGGLVMCGGTCIDVTADSGNCGSCSHVCSGGQSCQNRVCKCDAGLKFCGGTCIDVSSDAKNCGACNVSCNGQPCVNGACKVANVMNGCNGFLACLNNCADQTCAMNCGKNVTQAGYQAYIALYCCLFGNGINENICNGAAQCPHSANGVCDGTSANYVAGDCDTCLSDAQMVGAVCYNSLLACQASQP